jgi:formylglycine-generating enzyme required for sulfatase activity
MNYGDRTFPDPFPPDCAAAWGDDRFGLWFDLEIGGVTQRMRWIEPGTFWMGSDLAVLERFHAKDDPRWWDHVQHETPRHLVTMTVGYWLADTACTQALWKAVVGDAPSHFKTDPELPVENVSWDDITDKFLPAVQREVSDLTVALPIEAQWEYACRAGRESAYWFGDKVTKEQANFEAKATVPVKARPANGWGLYQMHGNVWELCEGGLREFKEAPVENPPDGQDQKFRALRGGSWDAEARDARSAYRHDTLRGLGIQYIGFRFSLRPIKPSHGIQSGGAR